MKQTLIKITDGHYIIVDDSEIKIGDWYYDFHNQEVCQSTFNKLPIEFGNCKKITHSTLPLEDVMGLTNKLDAKGWVLIKPIYVQEVKELIGEVDVEKKAEEYADFSNDYVPLTFGYKFNTNTKRDYLAGYNQALKDNKKRKYTEEDLRMAYKEGAKSQRFNARLDGSEKTIDETIQSLQPKTEWEVEIVDGKLKLKL